MTRTATLASSNHLISMITRTQTRVLTLQAQVSTEKKSETYGGLAADAAPLVDLETTRNALDIYERNNSTIGVRVKALSQAVSALKDTVQAFRNELVAVGSAKPLDATHIADVQQAAFRGLKNMEALLNTEFNGQFLFGGSRTSTQPVSFGADDLDAFQEIYNGDSVVFPPTRDADVATQATLDQTVTGGLTFAAGPPGTITATATDAFTTLKEGATIRVRDSTTGNDGYFTVVNKTADNVIEVDGTLTAGSSSFTIAATVNAGADNQATIEACNWYRGDTIAETHRVDADRLLTLSVNAIDPGFEKAIRAMGIVAQGVQGAAGGLDLNLERLDDALALVSTAVDRGSDAATPYGNELPGTVLDVDMQVGYHQVLLGEVTSTHKTAMALLEDRIASLENVDKTEAIAKLLDESNALEASYQALARIRKLSLTQFL